MSRYYTVEFTGVTLDENYDAFEIRPAANKPCTVHAIYLGTEQTVAYDADAMARVRIIRLPATATSGSGGATPTPTRLDRMSAVAGFGADTNNPSTTNATTTGTAVNLHSWAFNNGDEWAFIPLPDMRPRVENPEILVVRILNPGVLVAASGTIYIEESDRG